MNQEYTNISDLPLLDNITPSSYIPVEKENSENVKEGYKVDLNNIKPGTLNTDNSNSQETKTSESLSGTVNLHKVAKTGSYTDLNDKPTIPSVGTLNTNNSYPQTPRDNESFTDNIKLHKVAKTGSYTDLLNKPTGGTLNTDNSNSQATKTSESLNGTVKLHKVSKTGTYSDLINKPVLNTYNWNSLDTNKTEEINGTINLHAIAKTGAWYELKNKPYGYDLASCQSNPSGEPGSTINWEEGEPLRIKWTTVTNRILPSTYGNETHQVLDTCMILNFDDSHLLERDNGYPANFDGSTPIVIYIDPSFDFTYTDRARDEYTGIAPIIDLYARIVGRDDTRYDTTHPLSVVIGSWKSYGYSREFEIERELTCINPTSTLDITKDGYIRITGLMTYEIVQV